MNQCVNDKMKKKRK